MLTSAIQVSEYVADTFEGGMVYNLTVLRSLLKFLGPGKVVSPPLDFRRTSFASHLSFGLLWLVLDS